MNNVATTTPAITLSDAALVHVRKQISQRGHGKGLRLGIKKVGCSGFGYVVDFVDSANSDDVEFPIADDVSVFVDPKSLPAVQGTHLDYIRQGLNAGFEFHNPNVTGSCGCGESFSID